MPTSLRGIANKSRRDRKARFTDLYRLLNEKNLRWCFYQLRRGAAAGVDGVTFKEYERDLDANLCRLVERLKVKKYRARLVRRKEIPKGNGKTRPLGIPVLEDKLLQLACAKVLTAAYTGDFLDCSWGYRNGRGGREASRVLSGELYGGCYGWVVEADIRGFFDHIDHDWMERMLEQRVNDNAFLGLIRKWMKAGVLEADGCVVHPATGTPQGGVISPVLANIYLHYVLDLWFERVVKRGSESDAYMMRYADDFVCAFRYMKDALDFESRLAGRLAKFGLEVAPEKTRTLRFCRFDEEPNDAFEFLGFEFRWVRRRTGRMGVRRRTSPKKLRSTVKAMSEWIRKHRHAWRVGDLIARLGAKLRGYFNYYGVRGNGDSLSKVHWHSRRQLFKWLNRRSQRRSYTWNQFNAMLVKHPLPAPKIVEQTNRQLELFVRP